MRLERPEIATGHFVASRMSLSFADVLVGKAGGGGVGPIISSGTEPVPLIITLLAVLHALHFLHKVLNRILCSWNGRERERGKMQWQRERGKNGRMSREDSCRDKDFLIQRNKKNKETNKKNRYYLELWRGGNKNIPDFCTGE